MIVTVFRSRLSPGSVDDYSEWASRMSEVARSMPGYLSHKSFTADDGERLTLVEFDSEQSQQDWKDHPEHRAAQALGRDRFYSEYRLQVCSVLRETSHP